jgi:aryl-alcohol dehydrogenase-like predicted oxidoreductase
VAQENHLPSYQVLQPEYNLYDRSTYDGSLRELWINKDIGVVTYYSLASGLPREAFSDQYEGYDRPRGA